MADLEGFREETRRWLRENAPESMFRPPKSEDEICWGGRRRKETYPPDVLRWLDVMAERGWTAPTWPTEYGGGGLSKEEAKVLKEEMQELHLRPPLTGFGLSMIGPLLLETGTEEQKQEHLPKIVRGEIRWCQGYSEPGAGSDLAGLQTRATTEGDHYVLNGQKIWTSYADLADWMFLLVRTDPDAPKHKGITFLLMDMESEGVDVKPIPLISGASPFCETFLSDVRVPRRNVVGRENEGWGIAKMLLGFERTMIAEVFGERRESGGDPLLDLARKHAGDGNGSVADRELRDRITRFKIDQHSLNWTLERSREAAKAGKPPGPEASIFKYYGSELNKRRMDLTLSILGPQALGWEGPGFDDTEIQATRGWLRSRGNSIEGGTSEIQLNIIAKRVLGLPD